MHIVDLWKVKHLLKRSIQLEIHIRFAYIFRFKRSDNEGLGSVIWQRLWNPGTFKTKGEHKICFARFFICSGRGGAHHCSLSCGVERFLSWPSCWTSSTTSQPISPEG